MSFSFITKNLNWEISTKNLVIFKRWDGVNDEKLQYYGSLWGCMKNQYIGGELPKDGAFDNLQIQEGAWQKRGG